ncbi:MAG: response regulator [Rickettsiales bacterium]
MKETLKHTDCELVVCADYDMLLISRDHDTAGLQAIAKQLAQHTEQTYELHAYCLPDHWRELHMLLQAKSHGAAHQPLLTQEVAAIPTEQFGDIASLSDVFAEACKRRKARSPLHILLVEDDPLTRRIAASVFKEDYALITAKDAEDAIGCYFAYAPDIVFLDINLPDADGFNVLRHIIANDPESYVVMFSGNSYLDNITRAFSQGAQGFIAKPFNRNKMHHYVTDCAIARRKYAQA